MKSQIHRRVLCAWKSRNGNRKWREKWEQQALPHTQLLSPQLLGLHQLHMHTPSPPTSPTLHSPHTSLSLSPNRYNSQTLYARNSEIPHYKRKCECKCQRNWSERGNGEEGRRDYGAAEQDQQLSLCSCCS